MNLFEIIDFEVSNVVGIFSAPHCLLFTGKLYIRKYMTLEHTNKIATVLFLFFHSLDIIWFSRSMLVNWITTEEYTIVKTNKCEEERDRNASNAARMSNYSWMMTMNNTEREKNQIKSLL